MPAEIQPLAGRQPYICCRTVSISCLTSRDVQLNIQNCTAQLYIHLQSESHCITLHTLNWVMQHNCFKLFSEALRLEHPARGSCIWAARSSTLGQVWTVITCLPAPWPGLNSAVWMLEFETVLTNIRNLTSTVLTQTSKGSAVQLALVWARGL